MKFYFTKSALEGSINFRIETERLSGFAKRNALPRPHKG
jgi:hypothetical protein